MWLCWACLAAFSSCRGWGLLSPLGEQASHCSGLPCCGPPALACMGFSTCGSVWNLSSQSTDWTHSLCMARPIPNHWTTREIPSFTFFDLSSVQLLSLVQLFATPWTAARQASLSITNSQSLLKLMSIESLMPSNHLILCRPPSPPAFSLSQHQGLFKWVSSSHRVAKVLEF